jgi:hypothetical protein
MVVGITLHVVSGTKHYIIAAVSGWAPKIITILVAQQPTRHF